MTEAVDISSMKARDHLFSMMARGKDASAICADMKAMGWPGDVVLEAVHALLDGTMSGNDLTPSERAKIILCGAAEEYPKALGGWHLRGRPASTADVIRAANVVLGNFSKPLLKYPGIS